MYYVWFSLDGGKKCTACASFWLNPELKSGVPGGRGRVTGASDQFGIALPTTVQPPLYVLIVNAVQIYL